MLVVAWTDPVRPSRLGQVLPCVFLPPRPPSPDASCAGRYGAFRGDFAGSVASAAAARELREADPEGGQSVRRSCQALLTVPESMR